MIKRLIRSYKVLRRFGVKRIESIKLSYWGYRASRDIAKFNNTNVREFYKKMMGD